MTTIYVEDPDGKVHTVSGKLGTSLVEVIRWAGLPLRSSCGGCCACGTCHVIFDDENFARIGKPNKEEDGLLDTMPNVTPTSRLSCQIVFDETLQDLKLKLLNPWR